MAEAESGIIALYGDSPRMKMVDFFMTCSSLKLVPLFGDSHGGGCFKLMLFKNLSHKFKIILLTRKINFKLIYPQ